MGATAKISKDYTIEIPEGLRGKDGWRPGQEITLVPGRGSLAPAALHPFDSVHGIAKGANPDNYRDRNDRY